MRLTLQQLEAHPWGAANILRGKTAGQDYKNYIRALARVPSTLGASGPSQSALSLRLEGRVRGARLACYASQPSPAPRHSREDGELAGRIHPTPHEPADTRRARLPPLVLPDMRAPPPVSLPGAIHGPATGQARTPRVPGMRGASMGFSGAVHQEPSMLGTSQGLLDRRRRLPPPRSLSAPSVGPHGGLRPTALPRGWNALGGQPDSPRGPTYF